MYLLVLLDIVPFPRTLSKERNTIFQGKVLYRIWVVKRFSVDNVR